MSAGYGRRNCHSSSCGRFLTSQRGSFVIMLCLTFTYFTVELTVGYKTNSMALVADSFHMLSDLLSLTIGFISLVLSQKKNKNPLLSYGWSRIEVIGALANCVFLLSLCLSIAVEAIQRLIAKSEITEPKMILIVGGVGLFINIFGILLFQCHTGCILCGTRKKSKNSSPAKNVGEKYGLLSSDRCDSSHKVDEGHVELMAKDDISPDVIHHGHHHHHHHHGHGHGQMNLKGVLLHLMGDFVGSIVVITSTIIFIVFDGKPWTWYIDPTMSLILVSIILWTTIPLLKSSADVLMMNTPKGINVKKLSHQLKTLYPCIHEIPLFHVWKLDSQNIICTIHIVMSDIAEYRTHVRSITELLNNEGIQNLTIHPEFLSDSLHPNQQSTSLPTIY